MVDKQGRVVSDQGVTLKLSDLKIPDSVRVEALPTAGVPLKPNGEVDDAEQKRLMAEIKALIAKRSTQKH